MEKLVSKDVVELHFQMSQNPAVNPFNSIPTLAGNNVPNAISQVGLNFLLHFEWNVLQALDRSIWSDEIQNTKFKNRYFVLMSFDMVTDLNHKIKKSALYFVICPTIWIDLSHLEIASATRKIEKLRS